MNKHLAKVVDAMERALKHDIRIKEWNCNVQSLQINTFRLDDVYSTQFTMWCDGSKSAWQSETYHCTKLQESIAIAFLKAATSYIEEGGNIKKIKEVLDKYQPIFDKVYELKYSTNHLIEIIDYYPA